MFDPLQLIYEGFYDPCVFKLLFIIGGTGSGKSYISEKLGLAHMGLVLINSDYPLEKYMIKQGLDLKMPANQHDQRVKVRQKAKDVTQSKEDLAISQRLGLLVNGTGADLKSTIILDEKLKSIGYDSAMILVNTDQETALKRNSTRNRSVPNEIAIQKWNEVQKNIGFYQNHFDPFYVIDNSEDSDVEPQIQNVYKKVFTWCRTKPRNSKAIEELQKMKADRGIKS